MIFGLDAVSSFSHCWVIRSIPEAYIIINKSFADSPSKAPMLGSINSLISILEESFLIDLAALVKSVWQCTLD